MHYLCCLQNFIFLESVQYIKRYVYDQNFWGGGEGVVDGEGGSSEGCLKWGGRGWGSLRDICKKHPQTGVGKGKNSL